MLRKVIGYGIFALLFGGCAALGSLFTGIWWSGFAVLAGAAAIIGLIILATDLTMGE